MKEENFWEFCRKNKKEATEFAENLIQFSNVRTTVATNPSRSIDFAPEEFESDLTTYFYTIQKLSKEEISAIILMNNYMRTCDVSPKELQMTLLSCDKKKNQEFHVPAISALSKYPEKHLWVSFTPKKEVLNLSDEEIFKRDVLYSLEELHEHGSSHMILSISTFHDDATKNLGKKDDREKNDKKLF